MSPSPSSCSGDGFVTVADGTKRWGRFGAAGILLRHTADDGEVAYFLARRSTRCHMGGTWAVPGGALDQGEEPLAGALREFTEEIGHTIDRFELVDVHHDDHGGWTYTTVILDVDERFDAPGPFNWETDEAVWVAAHELEHLELLDAFRATLVRLGFLPPPG